MFGMLNIEHIHRSTATASGVLKPPSTVFLAWGACLEAGECAVGNGCLPSAVCPLFWTLDRVSRHRVSSVCGAVNSSAQVKRGLRVDARQSQHA